MNLTRLFILCVLIVSLFLLTSCSTTVPVTVKFPPIPEELNVQCPPLNKIPPEAKLSDISKTITENYKQYKDCSTNNSGLIEWFNKQKKIFEELQ
jgi:hypothetical protein